MIVDGLIVTLVLWSRESAAKKDGEGFEEFRVSYFSCLVPLFIVNMIRFFALQVI